MRKRLEKSYFSCDLWEEPHHFACTLHPRAIEMNKLFSEDVVVSAQEEESLYHSRWRQQISRLEAQGHTLTDGYDDRRSDIFHNFTRQYGHNPNKTNYVLNLLKKCLVLSPSLFFYCLSDTVRWNPMPLQGYQHTYTFRIHWSKSLMLNLNIMESLSWMREA